jgi:hypothetical protein
MDFEIDEDLISKFQLAGFKIKLILDDKGYLVDEPRFVHDDSIVPIDPSCPDPPPTVDGKMSLKGYRVRLRKPGVDVDATQSGTDPMGCRLIAGVWYC